MGLGGERAGPVTAGGREWLRVRRHLREHRHELGVAASRELYPDLPRVPGTGLLTTGPWLPDAPVPLDAIALTLRPDAPPPACAVPGATPFVRYSEGMSRLARPATFENRSTYRLLGADLRGPTPALSFGLGRYFDGLDYGEAVAHEFAARVLDPSRSGTARSSIGSPVDPARRPVNIALSTLTIRLDRATGAARFLLHWRDPALVGHAGGLLQVVPVGIFQPATEHPGSVRNDFVLWRCLQREYAEELLGEEEAEPSGGIIDYSRWPLAVELDAQRRAGTIRAFCLGMGVDALTLATDLLCVVVIDAPAFDRAFGGLVAANAEGRLVGGLGTAFVASEIERLVARAPMQAAGAAVLALAWEHRTRLLG